MEVSCPNCAFTRHVPEDKLPATAVMATCPRCKTRFAFRERVAAPQLVDQAPVQKTYESAPQAQPRAAREQAVTPQTTAAAPKTLRQPTPQPVQAPIQEHIQQPIAEAIHEAAPAADPVYDATHAPDHHAMQNDQLLPPDVAVHTPESFLQEEVRPDQAFTAPPEPVIERSQEPKASAVVDDAPTPQQEPVRKTDIWAKLSAMGQGVTRSETTSRPEPGAQATEKAKSDDNDSIWSNFDKFKGHTPKQATSLMADLLDILTAPISFFGGAGLSRTLKDALLFNVVVSEFFVVANFLGALTGMRTTLFSVDNPLLPADLPGALPVTFLMMLLVVPFLMVLGAMAGSGLTHVLLLAFRMAKSGFATTFRVVCYSMAPAIFMVLPILISFLPSWLRVLLVFGLVVWQMSLEVLGLSKSHQAALPQTVAAVLGKWTFFILILGVLVGNTLS